MSNTISENGSNRGRVSKDMSTTNNNKQKKESGTKSSSSSSSSTKAAGSTQSNHGKIDDCEAKTRKRSPNKLYKTPPTPTPDELFQLERGFTLDCIAVDSMSKDYQQARPKYGQVVPPYNSQRQPSTKGYFSARGVDKTLRRTGQSYPGESLEGPSLERFYTMGPGHQYFFSRNACGAGHSRDTIDGHAQFMSDLKPIDGYNGRYGYRRTTPTLREQPSIFGLNTRYPIY